MRASRNKERRKDKEGGERREIQRGGKKGEMKEKKTMTIKELNKLFIFFIKLKNIYENAFYFSLQNQYLRHMVRV